MAYYAVRLVEELAPDGRSTWYADHLALPGCNAAALTPDAAQAALERSQEAWLAWAAANGVEVPQPLDGPSVMVQYALRPQAARATEVDADVASRETFQVGVAA